MKKLNILSLALFSTLLMFSCSEDEDPTPAGPLEVTVIENLHAPADVMDRETGEITEESPYQYFSFEENRFVPSESGNWDIGIKGLNIIVNNGVSGDGSTEAAVINGIFDEYNSIPDDLELKIDTDGEKAIPGGSGNGWYNYNMATHVVSPIPGRILIIKTNGGNYVKMEILSYYRDNPPLNEVDLTTPSAYYTFQYVLQPNGSKEF